MFHQHLVQGLCFSELQHEGVPLRLQHLYSHVINAIFTEMKHFVPNMIAWGQFRSNLQFLQALIILPHFSQLLLHIFKYQQMSEYKLVLCQTLAREDERERPAHFIVKCECLIHQNLCYRLDRWVSFFVEGSDSPCEVLHGIYLLRELEIADLAGEIIFEWIIICGCGSHYHF